MNPFRIKEPDAVSARGRFAPASIRRHLTVIVLAALLPTGFFAAALLYAVWSDQSRKIGDELVARTQTVASLVQGEIDGTVSRLRVLATDPTLSPDRLLPLHRRLAMLLRENPDWSKLALQSSDGELLDASRPFPLLAGEPGPLLPVHREALATGRPAIADHPTASPPGMPSTVIVVPAERSAGAAPLLVSAALDLGHLSEKLSIVARADGGVVALIDRDRRFLARSRDPATYIGRPVSDRLAAAMQTSDSGLIRGETREGEPTFTAFERLPAGFFVGVATPSRPYDQALARSLLILAGILVAMLALGLVLSQWLMARINRHVAQTVDVAGRLVAGQDVPRTPVRIRELAAITDAIRSLFQREREARDKERAAGRAKDEFLAMLGHELRNPLAPIVTALHLMRVRGGRVLEHERGIIERQVRHLQRLVDDLLDIARIARGAIELKREPVEIAAVVADALETAGPALAAKRIACRVEVAPEGLLVDGDPARLCQVVANLLMNSAKYSAMDGPVGIEAVRDGERMRLRIVDAGSGLLDADRQKIFEPFAQGKQSVDRPEGGLGLGLSIARTITRLHGGELTAHSEGPGRGSTFELTLPLAAGGARRAAERDGAFPGPDRVDGPMVMIVDDNVDAALALAELLELWGYRTRTVHDGREVLPLLAESRPDVVLLDIGLPGLDGYQVAAAIRNDPRWSAVRLIALTGYGQASDVARSAAAGFERHLVKPVDPRVLGEILASAGSASAAPA